MAEGFCSLWTALLVCCQSSCQVHQAAGHSSTINLIFWLSTRKQMCTFLEISICSLCCSLILLFTVSFYFSVFVCVRSLCFPVSPLPPLALCFLLVVSTPTLACSTLNAVRLPDSPPESSLTELCSKNSASFVNSRAIRCLDG